MPDELTVTKKIHFSMANRGKRQIKPGPAPVRDSPDGRVPRISRLMALAIRFDQLLATAAVRDQAELAKLEHVTRARITQIMNLLRLAPESSRKTETHHRGHSEQNHGRTAGRWSLCLCAFAFSA